VGRHRWWVHTALLVFASLPGTVAAQADDERARLHFEAGRSHYEEGAYDRAREEFVRAWELSRRPPLLLNLAQANERLARYDEAAQNIEEYLALDPSFAERDLLQRRIENLRRLARERAPAPVEPAAPLAVHDAMAQPRPSSSGPDGGLIGGAAAALGVGGAGLVLWGVFGGLTIAEDSELASGCGATVECTADDVADLDTFSLAADISMGVGIAGVAVGTVLLIVALASGSSEDAAAALRFDGRNLVVHF
jgi:tetratricopeptide (TPR) repeat protein